MLLRLRIRLCKHTDHDGDDHARGHSFSSCVCCSCVCERGHALEGHATWMDAHGYRTIGWTCWPWVPGHVRAQRTPCLMDATYDSRLMVCVVECLCIDAL